MNTLLLKNATIVTQNDARDVVRGDIYIENGMIAEIGKVAHGAETVVDCSGKIVIPGLIQTHVHLIQTLFRNQADDMSLIDWLTKRIYLLEAAHTPESVYWSGMLTCAEMISGGTTTVVDMGTVLHEGRSFEALRDSGMRGYSGKMLMDRDGSAPDGLIKDKDAVLKETLSLMGRWHMHDNGRLRYLFAPRFSLSCTDGLLKEIARLSSRHNILVHTHASENKEEVRQVLQRTGLGNIEYLDSMGLVGHNVLLAHCIWAKNRELSILQNRGATVLHCPLANLKLASGIAPVPAMLDMGINVTLGSDGAPCNNTINMFNEMRAAALLHKATTYDPTVVAAQQVFDMATRNAARALGRIGELGVIAPGACADLAVVSTSGAHMNPHSNPIPMLVYCAQASDVEMTIVGGNIVYDMGFTELDEEMIMSESSRHCESIMDDIEQHIR